MQVAHRQNSARAQDRKEDARDNHTTMWQKCRREGSRKGGGRGRIDKWGHAPTVFSWLVRLARAFWGGEHTGNHHDI